MSAKTKFQSRVPAKQVLTGTKIEYTDKPLGKTQVIPDFLPSPSELAFREEGVKVTLAEGHAGDDAFIQQLDRKIT